MKELTKVEITTLVPIEDDALFLVLGGGDDDGGLPIEFDKTQGCPPIQINYPKCNNCDKCNKCGTICAG